MAKYLHLLRHGEPEEGYTQRFLGRLDPRLSQTGEAQAARIAARIRALAPNHCLASPLRRARATAGIAAAACGLAVEECDLLLELDFGELEGKNYEEAKALYPINVDSWLTMSGDFSFPGGEDFPTFDRRVARLADLVRSHPAERLLLVAHGGVLRGLLCRLLGLPANGPLRFRLAYASLTNVTLGGDGEATLTGFNIGRELPAEVPM